MEATEGCSYMRSTERGKGTEEMGMLLLPLKLPGCYRSYSARKQTFAGGRLLLLPLNMIWSLLLPRRIFICVRAHTRTHTRIHTHVMLLFLMLMLMLLMLLLLLMLMLFLVAATDVAADVFAADAIA